MTELIEKAEQFLSRIADNNLTLKVVLKNPNSKKLIMDALQEQLEVTMDKYPQHAEAILSQIVKFYSCKDPERKINDFISLICWYNMCLADNTPEYWDTTNKYYPLRLNEVINMFLIGRNFDCTKSEGGR